MPPQIEEPDVIFGCFSAFHVPSEAYDATANEELEEKDREAAKQLANMALLRINLGEIPPIPLLLALSQWIRGYPTNLDLWSP